MESLPIRSGSTPFEQQSCSQIVESVESKELAADRFRRRTENTQQLEKRNRSVDDREHAAPSVRLRTRVSVVLHTELEHLGTLCEQLAALLCALEQNQQRKRIEFDLHISALIECN